MGTATRFVGFPPGVRNKKSGTLFLIVLGLGLASAIVALVIYLLTKRDPDPTSTAAAPDSSSQSPAPSPSSSSDRRTSFIQGDGGSRAQDAPIEGMGTAADTTQTTAQDPVPPPPPTSPAPPPSRAACTFSEWKPVVFEFGGNGRHCFVKRTGPVDCDMTGGGEGLFYRDIVGSTDCDGGDSASTMQAARDEAARSITGMDTGIDSQFAIRFSQLLPLLIAAVNNAGSFTHATSRVSWGSGALSPRDFIASLIQKHDLKQLAIRPCSFTNTGTLRDLSLCQSIM